MPGGLRQSRLGASPSLNEVAATVSFSASERALERPGRGISEGVASAVPRSRIEAIDQHGQALHCRLSHRQVICGERGSRFLVPWSPTARPRCK